MSLKNKLKGYLFKLPKPAIDSFYLVYNRIKYPEMTEKKTTFGDLNEDKYIYIIRPRTDGVEGLMSLFMNVVKHLNYAEKRGYVPVVDFENYSTQYKDTHRETPNVWEYYFKQVSEITLEQAYQSRHVILSGLSALNKCERFLDQKMDEESLEKARIFIKKYIYYSQDVREFANVELAKIPVENTLGLYLRGTDYVKLKPSGHPIQPTVEQAIEIAETIKEKHELEYVFLVTEDEEIYKEISQHFGNMLKIVTYDSFISNYTGNGFLSLDSNMVLQLANTPYQRGLNYLTKLIILSKCKCFVGGNTCGSWATHVLSDGFAESYVFDLGVY